MGHSIRFTYLLAVFLCCYDAAAQSAGTPNRWQAEAYGFGVYFGSQIGYEPGWGGGIEIGRRFLSKNFSLFSGVDYILAEQRLRLVDGYASSFVWFYSWNNAARFEVPLFEKTALTTSFLTRLIYLAPRPVTFSNTPSGKTTIHPNAEVKLSPGFALGLNVVAVGDMAVNLQIVSNLLRVRKRSLLESPGEMAWCAYWRLRFGLAYAF